VDVLVAVGEGARELAEAARKAGLPESCVWWFPDAESAVGTVAALVLPGDLVLVKGSRAVGLERVAQAVVER
jgi:UDP-N-acetylmuramoyl-tripeptide--D-alanyl-D-alanine ligase